MTVKYPLLCVTLWTVGCYACKSQFDYVFFCSQPVKKKFLLLLLISQFCFNLFDELKTKDLNYYQGYTFLLNYRVQASDWCLKEQGQI